MGGPKKMLATWRLDPGQDIRAAIDAEATLVKAAIDVEATARLADGRLVRGGDHLPDSRGEIHE